MKKEYYWNDYKGKKIWRKGFGNSKIALIIGKEEHLKKLKGEGNCAVKFCNGCTIVISKMTYKSGSLGYIYRIATQKDLKEIYERM